MSFKTGDKVRVRTSTGFYNAIVRHPPVSNGFVDLYEASENHGIILGGASHIVDCDDVIHGWPVERPDMPLFKAYMASLAADPTRKYRDAMLARAFGIEAPPPVTIPPPVAAPTGPWSGDWEGIYPNDVAVGDIVVLDPGKWGTHGIPYGFFQVYPSGTTGWVEVVDTTTANVGFPLNCSPQRAARSVFFHALPYHEDVYGWDKTHLEHGGVLRRKL